MKTESQKGWMLGIVTAVAASLCCITPVLALISGVGGIAATFSWLEPARPYLVGITIAALGFAWYQKLKPRKQTDVECDCEEEEGKTNFWQSKTFLGIITLFAVATLTFPTYSQVFYPKSDKHVVIVKDTALKTVDFSISGMTCTSCEEHIKHAVNELDGVIEASASYKDGKAVISYDASKTSPKKIKEAINGTGYKVVEPN